MAKVSIVVPVYNVEKYLAVCIESLCAQTLRDIEIILVDDGSPDNSGAICDEYAAKDARIKVLHKKNGGVGAARNDGFQMATGEYVIFVDSDDYIPIDAYEKMYNKAQATDADIVIGDVFRVKGETEEYAQFYAEAFETDDRDFIDKLIQADFYNTYCPKPAESGPAFGYGGPWNKIVRRSMLLENNIVFDVSVKGIFDDIIYSAYILAVAKRIAYIVEPVYYYRLIGSSITQTYKKDMLEINEAIFNSWNVFMGAYGVAGQFEEVYYANVVRRLEQSLEKYFFSKKNPQSFKERIRELKATIISEPYNIAVNQVSYKKLLRRHRWLSSIAKRKSALGIWFMYYCKRFIKR